MYILYILIYKERQTIRWTNILTDIIDICVHQYTYRHIQPQTYKNTRTYAETYYTGTSIHFRWGEIETNIDRFNKTHRMRGERVCMWKTENK